MTAWKPCIAMTGALGVTLILCLIVPTLGTIRAPKQTVEDAPVMILSMPARTTMQAEATAPTHQSVSAPQSPSAPSVPLILPVLPGSSQTALPAPATTATPGFAAPSMPSLPGNTLQGQTPDFDTPPRLLVHRDPFYPPAARKAGTQGHVLLKVLVNENGRVTETEVVASEPPGVFDPAAIKAVRSWRFEPAKRFGNPVAVRLNIPIRFTLD